MNSWPDRFIALHGARNRRSRLLGSQPGTAKASRARKMPAMRIGNSPNFTHRLRYRSLKDSNQVLVVLKDDQGWLYVEKLAGTHDAGPYSEGELSMAFNVEPQPLNSLPLPE